MKLRIWMVILASLTFMICERNNMAISDTGESSLKQLSQSKLDNLSMKKIFFGHQSVGYNIIDGLREISNEAPNVKLNIVETKDSADFDAPIFAHSAIGKNKDPISKVDDFRKIMESGVGDKVDIAFFKFCYVDIVESTDVNYVLKYFTETMDYLQHKYPKVVFVYISVPLRVINTSIKANLKRLLRRPVWGDEDNIKRNLFNRSLADLRAKNIKIFDLARHESAYPEGKEVFLQKDNKKYFSLRPDLTNDGGHLNSLGSRVIAAQLLSFLADIYGDYSLKAGIASNE